MSEWLLEFASMPPWLAYFSLFILAFLAASLLPMGSEWWLLLLLSQGQLPWMLWLVATVGNTLGSVLNYGMGYYARHWVQRRQHHERWQQAERWFDRYGIWSMLLAWLPIVGDPLTLVAGVLRANFGLFLLLVALGKAARYGVLVLGYVHWMG